MTCWVCGEAARPVPFELLDADRGVDRFRFLACPSCLSGAIDDPPGEELLAGYYDNAYYGSGESKFAAPLQFIVNRSVSRLADRIMESLPRNAALTVLDIGCGRGVLLRELIRRGVRGIGLERHEPATSDEDTDLDIRLGGLRGQNFTDSSFDAVILWHVLEHLRDPADVLEEIGRILKPGGQLVLAVPNTASWQARMFGAGWFHVDAPRHLFGFGHRGLMGLLQRTGYDIALESTRDPVQNIFGFIQSSLNKLPNAPPNRLYQLMRSAQSPRRVCELMLWLMAVPLLAVPALIEFVASSLARAGASSIIFATRR
jgi:SAM-dependent methyltransferase